MRDLRRFRAVLDTSRNSIGRVSRRGSERGLVLSADASSEVRWGARNTVTDLGTRAPDMRLLGGTVQNVCQSCALGRILRVLRGAYHCKSCSVGRDHGELGSAFTSKSGRLRDPRWFRSVPDTSRNSIGRVSLWDSKQVWCWRRMQVVRSDEVFWVLRCPRAARKFAIAEVVRLRFFWGS